MESRALTAGQLRGLLKLGDVLVPGDGVLPPFSRSGAAEHAGRMLDFLYDDDRDGVRLLLTSCRFLPRFAIRALVASTERFGRLPGRLGALLRTVRIGLRGTVFTLYYSDVGEAASVFEALGWEASVGAPSRAAERDA